MSELKDLVPDLELCKKIPAGEFQDSAFVWLEVGIPQENKKEWRVVNATKPILACHNPKHPAPTLQEIVEKIGGIKNIWYRDPLSHNSEKTIREDVKYKPSITYFPDDVLSWRSMRWVDSIWEEYDTTAVDAAIRTYLDIKGIKVAMPCPECETWLQPTDKENPQYEYFDNNKIEISEFCPKCGYKCYDQEFLCFIPAAKKYLIEVNTPMGYRWIKKSKN